jgi:hypothetical protein
MNPQSQDTMCHEKEKSLTSEKLAHSMHTAIPMLSVSLMLSDCSTIYTKTWTYWKNRIFPTQLSIHWVNWGRTNVTCCLGEMNRCRTPITTYQIPWEEMVLPYAKWCMQRQLSALWVFVPYQHMFMKICKSLSTQSMAHKICSWGKWWFSFREKFSPFRWQFYPVLSTVQSVANRAILLDDENKKLV